MDFQTLLRLIAVSLLLVAPWAGAQEAAASPSEDIEKITTEAEATPEAPVFTLDRPLFSATRQAKHELSTRYGVTWAVEDTLIYQHTSGGFDPDDAAVNTLGFFATWKIFRDQNGLDFGGFGFQAEMRCNLGDEFTDLRDDLGTLWSPNDSTSDAYAKINQLWWAQQFAEGRLGFAVGKIDPGSRINENRFAGSGNKQFFGQPYATNPARSFPQNGLGFMARVEPVEWLHLHFVMSDSDAVSTYSPFKTINGNWIYAGELALKPKIEGLGQGMYRAMVYYRDTDAGDEVGWSISADQNLSEEFGVFLRYGGNQAEINRIEHLVATGVSWLKPFGRVNDQTGVAVSWTLPSDEDLRDQYASEVYYRVQLTEGIELSASAQLIVDPADSDQDVAGVFGLRCRVLY